MPTPILLPNLETGAEPVRVSCWLVEPGDHVDASDRVVEVVMRGITFDVPAGVPGRLIRVEKDINVAVQPGDCLGWIEADPQERNEQAQHDEND